MMEKVEIVATSHFTDSVVGSVSRKARMFIDSVTADRLEALGVVKIMDPRMTAAAKPQQTAPQVAGGGESSASSQAAQASPQTIAEKRPDTAGAPSPSTTPGGSHLTPTPSTPVTTVGGIAITQRSKLGLAGNAGRKTKAPPNATD